MANTRTNVTTAKPKIGGAIFVAPVGSTLPTDAVSALDLAFKCLGYAGEDGVKNANKAETDKVKAWGGDVVHHYTKEKTDNFQFKLLEVLNEEVVKTVYGKDNVTGTLSTGLTIKINDKEPEAHAWVFDMVLRDNVVKRIVLPTATITEVGEIVYSDTEPYAYETTLTADNDESGNSHYEYIKKGE